MRNNHHGGPRGVYGGGYGGPHDPRLNYGAHHNQYPINLSENESIKSNSSNKKKSDDELQVFVGGLESVSNSFPPKKLKLPSYEYILKHRKSLQQLMKMIWPNILPNSGWLITCLLQKIKMEVMDIKDLHLLHFKINK